MTLEHNPYAAPNADADVIQQGGAQPFKSLSGPATLAVFTIGGVVIFRLCFSAIDFHVFSTVEAVRNGTLEGSDELARSVELASNTMRVIAGVMLLLFLISVISTLVWIYRAHWNLRVFGNCGLKYTPGWCVAYWFIPIVSLFRPYQAMCELMNGSDPDRHPTGAAALQPQSGNLLLGFWWLFFLLMLCVSRVSNRIELSETEDFTLLFGLDTAETVLTVISGLLTIVVIRRVQAFQTRRRELLLAPEAADNSPFHSEPTW